MTIDPLVNDAGEPRLTIAMAVVLYLILSCALAVLASCMVAV